MRGGGQAGGPTIVLSTYATGVVEIISVGLQKRGWLNSAWNPTTARFDPAETATVLAILGKLKVISSHISSI
jgi:hypothetical protein